MALKLTSNVFPIRSGNADYKEIHKLDDVTRYNTSTFNVAFYKNTPNREGTPLPIKNRVASTDSKKKKVSAKEKYLGELIKKVPVVEKIYQHALKFRPRNTSVNFPYVRHNVRINTAVYNDYHIRETNSGFARNGFGGFFTK